MRTLIRRYAVGFCAASAGKISPYREFKSSAEDTRTASGGKRKLANQTFNIPSVTIIGGFCCDNATRSVLAVVYESGRVEQSRRMEQ